MSSADRWRAAAREAAARGRAAVDAAAQRARQADPRVDALARDAAARLGEATGRRRERRDELLARAGSSAAGAALGERVRALGRAAGRLPLLSAPMDLFSERSGVDALVAAVQADPGDVMAHLWLGEALATMQADARRFDQVRAVVAAVNPASLVLRGAIRTAATLGAAPTDPAGEVFARTRVLAATRLRADPRDAPALHALARVLLATGHPEHAVQPAKLAVAASTGADRARALVILARTYLVLGRDTSAGNVARKAVDAGCSLGWQVLAELLYRDGAIAGDEGTPRHRHYVELRARVTDDDRRAYHGAHRSAAEVRRSVIDAQRRRARELGEAAAGAAARRLPGHAMRAETVPIVLPPAP
ncbi:MAG: tetratricopeptide repeat protein [Pseudonocardia sp.]